MYPGIKTYTFSKLWFGIILALVMSLQTYGQTLIFNWTGGAGDFDWQKSTNWEIVTDLAGNGARAVNTGAPDNDPAYPGIRDNEWVIIDHGNDEIIFSNLPWGIPQTNGRRYFYLAGLIIKNPSNGAGLVQFIAPGTNYLMVVGDPTEGQRDDTLLPTDANFLTPTGAIDPPVDGNGNLQVNQGGVLKIGGNEFPMVLELGGGDSEGRIFTGGQVIVSGNIATPSVANQFRAVVPGSMRFQNPSNCVLGLTAFDDSFLDGHPFGNTGADETIVFENGSELIYNDGLSPFGSSPSTTAIPTIHKIRLEPGSEFTFNNQRPGPEYNPDIYNRIYGTFRYNIDVPKQVLGLSPTFPYGFIIQNDLIIADFPKVPFPSPSAAALTFLPTSVGDPNQRVRGYIYGKITLPDTDGNPTYAGNETLVFDGISGQGSMRIALTRNGGAIEGNSTVRFGSRASLEFGGLPNPPYTAPIGSRFHLRAKVNKVDGSTDYRFVDLMLGMRLDLEGENYIFGTGAFRIEAATATVGAEIGVGSVHGVNTLPSMLGNIRTTGGRNYFAGIWHFIANGDQNTGNAINNFNPTTPYPLTLNIDNVNPSAIVTLGTANPRINRLFLKSGNFNLNSHTLTMQGPLAPSFPQDRPALIEATGTSNFHIISGQEGRIEIQGRCNISCGNDLDIWEMNVSAYPSANPGVVDFGHGTILPTSRPTILNRLQLNSGASVVNFAPWYAPNSTLIYNTGNRDVGTEWTPNESLGSVRGVPHHVQVRNGTDTRLTIPATTFYQARGDIYQRGTNTTSSAQVTIASGAQLRVMGNWIRDNTPAISQTNGEVSLVFNGVGIQEIRQTTNHDITFRMFRIDNAGTLRLNHVHNILTIISGTSGNVLEFFNGDLDLNGSTLRVTGNGGAIRTYGSLWNVLNTHATNTALFQILFNENSAKLIASSTGGSITFAENVIVETGNNGSTLSNRINLGGTNSTILGTLRIRGNGQITNGTSPTYGPNSTLEYAHSNNRTVFNEWPSGSGTSTPMHVKIGNGSINNNSQLELNEARTCRGNMTIGDASGTGYALTLSGGSTQLNVGGSWLRNSNGTFTHNSRPVAFTGSTASTIQAPMPAGETFHTLILNKTTVNNTVTLNAPVTVTTALTLTTGRVIASPANHLHVSNTAFNAISGGSANAYVDGSLRRSVSNVGTGDSYIFTVGAWDGSNHFYRPFQLFDITVSSGTPTFTGAYRRGSVPGGPTYFFGGTIRGILQNQWWECEQTTGGTADAARIVLERRSGEGFMDIFGSSANPPDITDEVGVMYRNAFSNWNTTGPPGTLETALPIVSRPEVRRNEAPNQYGLISSVGNISLFNTANSRFSLGWSRNQLLVLPIRLLSFRALLQNTDALLNWEVADAAEVQSFEVEYSTNGERFTKIATIPKGGTKYSYRHTKLSPGMHYYRLHMISKDGTRAYSAMELVQLGGEKTFIRGLHQNPVQGGRALIKVYSPTAQDAEAIVVDNLGRVLLRTRLAIPAGDNQVPLSVLPLSGGMYRLLLRTRDGVEKTLPFVR